MQEESNINLDYDNNSSSDNSSYFFGMVFNDESMFDESELYKIPLTICLAVAMIMSIVGNVCTCVVIARNRSMRTPTNYYLFNLAVSDIVAACFIPMEIFIIWSPGFFPLGEVGCRIHFMLWDFASNCSLLIITAFTIERYLVVSRPFLRQKLTLNSRVFKIVAGIWVLSCLFAVPDFYYSDLVEKKKYVFCYFVVSYGMSVVLSLELIVFFITPMTLIIVLYSLIVVNLKSAQKKMRSSPLTSQQNKDKAVKMLAAVAISFFVFWSPYALLRIAMVLPQFGYYQTYYINPYHAFQNWKIMNYLCYNAYLSPVANPILYNLMSVRFRKAFKDLLKGRGADRRRSDRVTTISLTSSRYNSSNVMIQRFARHKLHDT